MGKSPAFQFYPGDWLSSPNVAMMTPEQEGAYIRLLCYAWADPDCSLPDDDEVLAKLSRLGEGWFNGGSTVVRKCFNQHPTKPERLFNQRLMKEREKQEEWRKKSIEGGIKSGKSRRLQNAKGGSTVVEPKGNSSSSSSSSSSENKKPPLPPKGKARKSKPSFDPASYPLPKHIDTPEVRSVWRDWCNHRSQKKQKITEETAKRAVNKLAGWGASRAIAAMEHSIANGWQGIFEPDDNRNGTPGEQEIDATKRIRRDL